MRVKRQGYEQIVLHPLMIVQSQYSIPKLNLHIHGNPKAHPDFSSSILQTCLFGKQRFINLQEDFIIFSKGDKQARFRKTEEQM